MIVQAADADFGALRHLMFSPIRFYRARLEARPRYLGALVPPAAYVVLSSAAVLVVTRKTHGVTAVAFERAGLPPLAPAWVGDAIGVVSSITAVCFLLAMSALAVVFLDMLFAQSGRGRRLFEFTALAYFSQLPVAVAGLMAAVWWWSPAPLTLPAGITSLELVDALRSYQEESADTAVLSTQRLIGSYFWCWLVALQAAALRVVSGFSVGGAWAAGILLGVLFVGIPYAVQQYW